MNAREGMQDNRIIIGLTGLKGSGKDTFAEGLVEDCGFRRFAFADLLKQSAAAALGVEVAVLDSYKNDPHAYVQLRSGSTTLFGAPPVSSITVRKFYQNYGYEAHREIPQIGDDFWINMVMDQVISPRWIGHAVITDARFLNEQQAVKLAGGYIVEVERDGTDVGDGHASENVSHGITDISVANDSTIPALKAQARQLVGLFRAGTLSR